MESPPAELQDHIAYIQEDVLDEITLERGDSLALIDYLHDRRRAFYGAGTRYFVLGSYETPFKYRVDVVATELNRRYNTYAYLLAPQPDLDLQTTIPELGVKFYIHALYADYITLVLEHNTGGALVEAGRCDRPPLRRKTYVLPRGIDPGATDPVDDPESVDDWHARAIEAAYQTTDEPLEDVLEALAEQAQHDAGQSPTKADLMDHIEAELGGRSPTYSGVLSDDVLQYYHEVGRCLPWTTEDELRDQVSEIP